MSGPRRRPVFLRFWLGLVIPAILVSLCAVPAWSQATSSANVSGLITSGPGAPVPGAEVKILDPATGNALNGVSDRAGRFLFPTVPASTYTVTISKQGFSTFRIVGQSVDTGSVLRIDAVLKAGAPTTFIDSQPVAVQQAGGSGASAMSSKSLASAPLLGNEAASMATLRTGTTSGGTVGGAMSDQNRFMLDGAPNTDYFQGDAGAGATYAGLGGTQTGGMAGVMPTSTETVDQVRVSNASADAANTMGGSIEMVTKRGTNQFHGAAYGSYFGSNWGGANTWLGNHTPNPFTGQQSTPLPVTHRSRFGGSLGGAVLPNFAGGKTYFFVNYEGSRFPNSSTYYAQDPSLLMRAGVIQIANSAGAYVPYNLNPTPVTVGGVTYQPAMCGSSLCDPRGIGLSPAIKQLWSLMPNPNEFYASGDQYNVQGYGSPVKAPLIQDSEVIRIDHDFSRKARFFAVYRHNLINNIQSIQVDIGGVLPGSKFGYVTPQAHRQVDPSDMVYGVTSSLRPNVTNDFRVSYLRNQWEQFAAGAPPQYAGLGGAIEPGGEATTSVASLTALTNTGGGGTGVSNGLTPYNLQIGGSRHRLWLGKDYTTKDDLTWVKGAHVVQFGAMWMHANNTYARNDNPQGSISYPVYQVMPANTSFQGFQYPSTVPSAQQTNFNTYYAYVLGMVSQTEENYTRNSKLELNPNGTIANNNAVVETYNIYVGDSYRIKPSVTLSYGLTYLAEMPPKGINGTPEITIADLNGNPFVGADYFKARMQAALAGQAYMPLLETVPTTMTTDKTAYAFKPFYGGLSPRIGVAWSPRSSSGILRPLLGDKKSTISASYNRVYGRLNAGRSMGSPMQPPGIMQSVSCAGPNISGQCTGSNAVTPSTVFRIGPDGLTAPLPAVTQVLQEPYTPGINGMAAASDFSFADAHFRPQQSDSITVQLTRQISNRFSIDVGYLGRKITKDTMPINIDNVPYMMTLGGQQFANAYANTYWAIPAAGTLPSGFTVAAQPFFESALGGAGSSYCTGYANCTTALAFKQTTAFRNTAVSDLWTAMYNAPSWTLGRTMLSQPVKAGQPSQGYSYADQGNYGWANYNSLYVSGRLRDWHGFTGTTNFTWGRALGTATTGQSSTSVTISDAYNMANNYGVQSFDIKFLVNSSLTYAPKIYASQKGVIGHVLGGWRFAPIFTGQSGTPTVMSYSEGSCTGCQAFGEVSTSSSGYKAITENAQAINPYPVSTRATYNSAGTNGVGTNNPTGINMFADPSVVLNSFRKCVLGYDKNCGGYALRGLPYWNMDLGITKSIKAFKEGRGVDLRFNFTNVFNHAYLAVASLATNSATTFGRITNAANTPRQFQSGIRIYF